MLLFYDEVRMSVLVTMQLHLSSLDQPLLCLLHLLIHCDSQD